MNYPYLTGAGLYRSEILGYRKDLVSPVRLVEEYEFELFTDNYTWGLLNGEKIDYRKNILLIAKPGDRRCSKLHFACHYIHIRVEDPEIRKEIDGLPPYFPVRNPESYVGQFGKIASLFPQLADDSPLRLSSLFLGLLADIRDEAKRTMEATGPDKSPNPDVIELSKTYISEHYDRNLKLSDLANYAHLSPNYFLTLFSEECGKTPLTYLTEVRISRAQFLLRTTQRSVSDIGIDCGFSSYNYFGFVFKKYTGMTPTEYRKAANRYYKL